MQSCPEQGAECPVALEIFDKGGLLIKHMGTIQSSLNKEELRLVNQNDSEGRCKHFFVMQLFSKYAQHSEAFLKISNQKLDRGAS